MLDYQVGFMNLQQNLLLLICEPFLHLDILERKRGPSPPPLPPPPPSPPIANIIEGSGSHKVELEEGFGLECYQGYGSCLRAEFVLYLVTLGFALKYSAYLNSRTRKQGSDHRLSTKTRTTLPTYKGISIVKLSSMGCSTC
ncbi:hypothetical protein M0804_001827 [Polistes exclamans]|nr:hypothetical protein M0804_001827 [Polistes exclamans]